MYVEQTDLKADVPEKFLIQALDDDGDGVADPGIWDLIATAACNDVDARLSPSHATPFSTPYPPIVPQAAKIFAMESVYQRRGFSGTNNPWTTQADGWRTRLDKIGAGEEDLLYSDVGDSAIIKEDSKLNDSDERLMA